MQSNAISQLRELLDVFLPLGAPLSQVLVPACERGDEEDAVVVKFNDYLRIVFVFN